MDVDIKFCKSAFTHGYTEADIRLAIDNAYMTVILKAMKTLKTNGCLSVLAERETRLKYITISLIKIRFGYFMRWNIGIFIINYSKMRS